MSRSAEGWLVRDESGWFACSRSSSTADDSGPYLTKAEASQDALRGEYVYWGRTMESESERGRSRLHMGWNREPGVDVGAPYLPARRRFFEESWPDGGSRAQCDGSHAFGSWTGEATGSASTDYKRACRACGMAQRVVVVAPRDEARVGWFAKRIGDLASLPRAHSFVDGICEDWAEFDRVRAVVDRRGWTWRAVLEGWLAAMLIDAGYGIEGGAGKRYLIRRRS